MGGCGLFDGPRVCTEQLVSITVEITGETLDQTYTIETATGDSVQQMTGPSFDNNYTVLDDGYHAELGNKEREFRFVGVKNGNVLVDELFMIRSDGCHVEKVSGIDTIDL